MGVDEPREDRAAVGVDLAAAGPEPNPSAPRAVPADVDETPVRTARAACRGSAEFLGGITDAGDRAADGGWQPPIPGDEEVEPGSWLVNEMVEEVAGRMSVDEDRMRASFSRGSSSLYREEKCVR